MTERGDLYREVTQPRQRRKPMLWLSSAIERRPDHFLATPTAAQKRRGSATTAATHRARQVLAKLGL